MADLKQWVKLWTKALTDPTLDGLDIADFGRWVKLILYVREHGTDGKICFTAPARAFLATLQCDSLIEAIDIMERFPNCNITKSVTPSVTCNVTLSNWFKYQIDSSAARVKKHRAKMAQNVTPKRRGEEKRGEETRKEEKKKRSKAVGAESLFGKSDPTSPQSWKADDLWLKTFLETQRVLEVDLGATKLLDPKWWDATSEACNGLDNETVQREFGKIAAYFRERPKKRPTPNGFRTFLRRWLERSAEWERKNA